MNANYNMIALGLARKTNIYQGLCVGLNSVYKATVPTCNAQ